MKSAVSNYNTLNPKKKGKRRKTHTKHKRNAGKFHFSEKNVNEQKIEEDEGSKYKSLQQENNR